MPRVHLTVVCEGGGLTELRQQLRWIGSEGMLVCFMERELGAPEDYLESRALELLLEEKGLDYQRMEGYHPDYQDERVMIYRITQ